MHKLISAGLECGDRQCLWLLSATLRDLYGDGLLGHLHVTDKDLDDHDRVEARYNLLRRQQTLEMVTAELSSHPNATPRLVPLLTQGCLHHVRGITLALERSHPHPPITIPEVQALTDALQTTGALPCLEHLYISLPGGWLPGIVALFAGALASGAAPSLRSLDICAHRKEEDMEALATMLEARAQLPACRGFEKFIKGLIWASTETRCRMLRVLLPSMTELYTRKWEDSDAPGFQETRPPLLRWSVYVDEAVPSVAVWEAVPVLEELTYGPANEEPRGLAELEPIISALDRGVAFQSLKKLTVEDFTLEAAEWESLLGALGGAACAAQLTSLKLSNMCPASVAILASFLRQDAFPMLEFLKLGGNEHIGGPGIATLAHGLMTASRTRLTHLDLGWTGMNDDGLAALVGLIQAGHFERLEVLDLSSNFCLTDKGVRMLTEAVGGAGQPGLPMLSKVWAFGLSQVTDLGMRALASALVENCPHLTRLALHKGSGSNSDPTRAMVEEIALAAGRGDDLDVKGWEPW